MTGFGIEHYIVGLFSVCSNGGLGVPKSNAALGFGFELVNSDERIRAILFYVFLWFAPRTSWRKAILDPGTFV